MESTSKGSYTTVGLPNNRSRAFIEAAEVAIDIETKDPDLVELGPGTFRGTSKIVGVSLAVAGYGNTYLDLNHIDSTDEDREANTRFVREVLIANNKKIGANIMYDLEHLTNHILKGENINGSFGDVQFAEPLIDEYKRSYSLSSLCKTYNEQDKGYQDLADFCILQGWQYKSPVAELWRMPKGVVRKYASWDAQVTLNIHLKQQEELRKQGLEEVYDLECRLIPLLLQMRFAGTRIDKKMLNKVSIYTADKVFSLGEKIKEELGDVDLNSSAQLAQAFGKKGIPVPRKALTQGMMDRGVAIGNPNLDKEVLINMKGTFPVCGDILEYRHYNTLVNMFLHPYRKFMVGDRIHCQFHPLRSDDYGTVSGRFSCSKPNLQQVSGTKEEGDDAELSGKLIRKLFIPEEGMAWAKLDYSQVEYRIQAHYAMGPGSVELRREYNDNPNTDYHQRVMDKTGLDRTNAKRLNFGSSYGMGEEACARKFNWSPEQAHEFISTYHAQHPFVRYTRREVVKVAEGRGYIFTVLGRRAHVNPSRKLHSMYNRLIQGSAADIMKAAMVSAHDKGLFDVLTPHITVHDEIDVSYDKGSKEHVEALAELKHTMETAVELSVPLIADVESGPNWGEVE